MRIPTIVATLTVAATVTATAQVSNAAFGYTLSVPEGFTAYPDGKAQPDVIDCWAEAGQNGLLLCVHRLRDEMPRSMRPDQIPAGMQPLTAKWKTFAIPGFGTETVQDGQQVFVVAAQVPLRHEAVQLTVGGPTTERARGEAVLSAVLLSMQGESNWLTSAERAGRLGTAAGWIIGIAVAAIAVRMWRNRRRTA
jgi:hypothetical protein